MDTTEQFQLCEAQKQTQLDNVLPGDTYLGGIFKTISECTDN